MTSREALDKLVGKTTIMDDTCASLEDCIKGCKCRFNEPKETCEDYKLFMIIEQDLDKLEQLEKKYQKLEETFKKRAELCSEFAEYTRQYEKVLDFLMDKFKLELKGNRLYFLYNNQYFELDKEQEKLWKEAFGYE